MATDKDGFQLVKRRGRHVSHSKVPKTGSASLEAPASSLRADDIVARVQSYRYEPEKWDDSGLEFQPLYKKGLKLQTRHGSWQCQSPSVVLSHHTLIQKINANRTVLS